MRLQLKSSHFCIVPETDCIIVERVTLLTLIETSNDLAWAKEFLHVTVNSIVISACWWPYVTVKPEADGLVVMTIVQGSSKVLPLVASVALIALTAGIGTFGVPFLGATFAAGSFGASALAAGVGIAGQLAINALTAPPSVRQSPTERANSQAGINVNQIGTLEILPTINGEIIYSPPIIAPTYVTLDADEETIHAIIGCQGRNLVTNTLINGIDTSLLDGLEIETREGAPGDLPLTLCPLTCLQQKDNVKLTNFRTKEETSGNDQLIHQNDPTVDMPDWHYYKTKGIVDEVWIRFAFPSGIIFNNASEAGVPIRIQARKIGDVSWRKFPTIHFFDAKLGSGLLKKEVKVKFQKQPSGRHFSNASGEYAAFEITNITAPGKAWEYQSDPYFIDSAYPYTSQIPIMTAATTTGVTMSASSELDAAHAAWKASDNFSGATNTSWQPANNSLPAWLKVDFGSAKILKSYQLNSDSATDTVPATAPLTWYVQGSTDNVNWARLDENNVDISEFPLPTGVYQIGTPGSYRFYRWNFLSNNGAANNQINVADFRAYLGDAPGIATGHDISSFDGAPALHNGSGDPRSMYGSLDKNGVTFYLDPAQWDIGEYEFRIMRGWAFAVAQFVPYLSTYVGATNNHYFFDYQLIAGLNVIKAGQKLYRSDTYISVFSSVSYDAPVDTSGITCIAVELKNTEITSISATFKSYARIWNSAAGVWTDAETPTSNPAALYRRLLMGHAHPNPQPTEIMDDDKLIAWYLRCEAAGHECNYVQQSTTIADVKQVISYTGYASPQEAEKVGIIEDYDRSSTGTDEAITQIISPLNSRLIGEVIPFPDVEHAIIAEFFDEDDDYKINRIIVYRDGYTALNSTLFVTVKYPGFTNTAKVTARAEFDMLQTIFRAATVQVEMDIEGLTLVRGQLVGHSDDVIEEHNYYGLIQVITEDGGGNIVSITINNDVPFSSIANDLDVLLEGIDPANPVGVGIRLNNASSLIKTLSTVTDGRVATFTTPFPMAGSGVAIGQLAVFGVAGKEFRRMIVMGSTPKGNDKRILSLAPEAPELFR